MSKRNIIIIAVVFVLLVGIAIVFVSLIKPAGNTNGGTTGTNFFSTLFPFGKNTTNTTTGPNPVDISGYVAPKAGETPKELLTKVSSMPVAGYEVFQKERFIDIPNPTVITPTPPTTDTTTTNPPTSTPTTTPTTPATTPKTSTRALKTTTTPVIPTPPTTELAPMLRYVERATGNVYQTFADKMDERKFTTTIIPEVYDAYLGNAGESVAMRYLKEDEETIETFVGTLPTEVLGQDTSTSEITGSFLPENIKDISMSPDNSSMFYLFDTGDSMIGVTATSSGDKKNQIFSSPFTEWLSQWPNDRMITLTTKPSFNVPGYMYSLDSATKKMTKILGGINGLTTLTSPSGKLILYNDNNLTLHVYNTDTENSVSVGIKTLPEKCVWDNASIMIYCSVPTYVDGTNYPDTWYQGETSFSDQIWKVNTENGNTTMVADPTSFSGGESIDGIKLSLSAIENYLFFVNKKDSYLWELNLK
jgi:hypothetical protein